MPSINFEKKNYVFLYRGLLIVRDALLNYIKDNLSSFHGPEWWEKGVEPAFRAEDMEKLKTQFKKRFSTIDGPARPGSELYEILDLNYFGNVIEYNWKKGFSRLLNDDRTLFFYIKEIVNYRNPVAHSETGDLRDDDTFRGLDTAERLLRLINIDAAEHLAKIKNEMRNSWIYQEMGIGTITPDQIGVDIEKGFARVEEAIRQKETTSPSRVNEFLRHKRTIQQAIRQHSGGQVGGEEPASSRDAFRALDVLSRQYIGAPFSAACIAYLPLPTYTPEEVSRKTLVLRREIEELQQEVKDLEHDLEFQQGLGFEQIKFVQSRLDHKKELLTGRQKELETIRDNCLAPVFFSVTRSLPDVIQEETPFRMDVQLKNLGKRAAKVTYEEGFDAGVQVVQGPPVCEAVIAPDESLALRYTCVCNETGSYGVFTQRLDYADKLPGWDAVSDTSFFVLPSKGPLLEGKHFYRNVPGGIELIYQLTNIGEKTAFSVHLDETINSRNFQSVRIPYDGDLRPQEKVLVSGVLGVSEITKVIVPAETCVQYADRAGQPYMLRIEGNFSLLRIPFGDIELVGRKDELARCENLFKVITGELIEGELFAEKRVALVEGPAGVGKSRFIQEVIKVAQEQHAFHVVMEDANTRTPVKRMLRALLGLDPEQASKEQVSERIQQLIPAASEMLIQRGALIRFLVSDFEKFEDAEIQRLKADVLLVVREVCEHARTLLVFDNAHAFSAGIEQDFFQEILKMAIDSRGIKLAVFVVYRSNEDMPGKFLGRDIRESRLERISLSPFDTAETEAFVTALAPFPHLSAPLFGLVQALSNGNAYFIKVLLRYILTMEGTERVQRIGDTLYPSPQLSNLDMPDDISDFLVQRAREDAGDNYPVLQVLAVVGLELPYRLLDVLFESGRVKLPRRKTLPDVLEQLEKQGFVRKIKTGSLQTLEYKFEHELLRDAIYEELHETITHMQIREQLVDVLIKNQYRDGAIYSDEEEYYRQIARHLLHVGPDIQYNQREYLISAARITEARRDIQRAKEYYQCLLVCSAGKENYAEQVEALLGVAAVQKYQGNLAEAEKALQNANDRLQAASALEKDPHLLELQNHIIIEQGYISSRLKKFDVANEFLTSARRAYEGRMQHNYYFPPKNRKLLRDLFSIYLYLFEIWYKNPTIVTSIWKVPMFPLHWNMSDTYSDRAIRIARKYSRYFQDGSLWLKAQIYKADVYIQKEERDLAYENLQKVIRLVQQRGHFDEYEIERAYTFLAEIYREREERDKALRFYEDARVIQEKLQDLVGLAITNGGSGDIYLDQGQLKEAEFALRKAYHYQQLVNDTNRLWRTCFSLMKIYLQDDNIANARAYWSHARAIILDRKAEIMEYKLVEMIQQLFRMAQKYYDNMAWKDALAICLDLQVLDNEIDELAGQNEEMIGKIYIQLDDADNAIKALYRGIEQAQDPVKRADLFKMIGDTCAVFQDAEHRTLMNTSYEECIRIYIESKHNTDAHDAFDKLLHNMSVSQDPSELAPFLHNLIELVFRRKGSFDQRFLQKAELLFQRYNLYREAGDTFVHIAHKLIQADTHFENAYTSKERETILDMLEKAHSYYNSCSSVDAQVSGYYKLIILYFRMDTWDLIAQCYREIMLALMHSNEPALLLQTFREYNMMENKFGYVDLTDVNDGIVLIDEVYRNNPARITEQQRHDFLMQWGKLLSRISNVCPEEDSDLYLRQALEQYNEIIASSLDTNLLGVSYNDSALILEKIGEVDEAKKRLLHSIQLAGETHNEMGEAQGQANYAAFLLRHNDWNGAVTFYGKSISILQQWNFYWNERRENQDAHPLTSTEIARLNFDKSWFASTARSFAGALFPVDPSQAIHWLEEARQAYQEINDAQQVRVLDDDLAIARKMAARIVGRPVGWVPDIRFDEHDRKDQNLAAVTCPACNYRFTPTRPYCPRCNSKVCPDCGSMVPFDSEFCQECDKYVGK